MKQLIIQGGKTLSGTINVGGAKNSAVALIPASLLSDEEVIIDNVPNITDIEALKEILDYLGAIVSKEDTKITIDSRNIENKEIPESISTKLRASYYFMSALLGKYKKVEMYFPGGCSIGARPIDQTLKGFVALGAEVIEEGNKFTITASKLVGAKVYLDMPSVGATINTIFAAVKAEGTTTIKNAAREPEIVNVATFLNNMGAKITGAGTNTITIQGVKKLGKAFIEVIPDRIEAGTYVILGALVGKDLKINNIIPAHIESLLSKLSEMGLNYIQEDNSVTITQSNKLKPISIKTLGYPGFPTDLQQPLTTLMTQCNGISSLEENLYENRFKNVEFLNNMGANIELIDNRHILIKGSTKLTGQKVISTDLRAGSCLVLAGLKATGTTIIDEVEHVLRGYENLIEKLTTVGAVIELKTYN